MDETFLLKREIATMEWLLEHGHGGGNWRRLIHSIIADRTKKLKEASNAHHSQSNS